MWRSRCAGPSSVIRSLSSIVRPDSSALIRQVQIACYQPQMVMIHGYGRLLLAATFSAALAKTTPYQDCPGRHFDHTPPFFRPGNARKECKCFPGDHCWPSKQDWDSLNQTVDGRLVATIPPASPCYHSWNNYDNATCAELRDTWTKVDTHIDSSSSIMAPFFANRSQYTS